jgi:hypothetical protein
MTGRLKYTSDQNLKKKSFVKLEPKMKPLKARKSNHKKAKKHFVNKKANAACTLQNTNRTAII